jgi:hypothetical protein
MDMEYIAKYLPPHQKNIPGPHAFLELEDDGSSELFLSGVAICRLRRSHQSSPETESILYVARFSFALVLEVAVNRLSLNPHRHSAL